MCAIGKEEEQETQVIFTHILYVRIGLYFVFVLKSENELARVDVESTYVLYIARKKTILSIEARIFFSYILCE